MKVRRLSVRTVAYLGLVRSSCHQECKGKSPLFCWSPAGSLEEPSIPARGYFNGPQRAQYSLCSETKTMSQLFLMSALESAAEVTKGVFAALST